jgi:hypothetical protein
VIDRVADLVMKSLVVADVSGTTMPAHTIPMQISLAR